MNTLAEILTEQFSDQGIQDLNVFYDSFIFNLKIKNSSEFVNILLIEKLGFVYDTELFERQKNAITLSFGDTETSTPFYTKGNCFIKSFLISGKKQVLLVGLKKMTGGNIIPVIYTYDINKHSVTNIFPKQSDIENFNSLTPLVFKDDNLPIVNFIDNKIYIIFQTEDATDNYVNSITISLNGDNCELDNYEIIKYSNSVNIQFIHIDKDFLNYKVNNFTGVLRRRTSFTSPVVITSGIFLDDNMTLLSLDSTQVLGLDV